MPSIFHTDKRDISPAPHLRNWKHHTQASKIDGKTCEWRTLFLFCSTIQRADSRGCFIAVELIQTRTSEGHHPPTGSGKRNKLQESWLMQGHPGVHSLPMSVLCFTSNCISSLKSMTKQYKTKDLHCSSQPSKGGTQRLLLAALTPFRNSDIWRAMLYLSISFSAKIIFSFIPLQILNNRVFSLK